MWYFQGVLLSVSQLCRSRHGRDADKYLYIKILVKPKDFAHRRLVLVKDFSSLKHDFMQNV